jgi:hypothetical protein
MVARNRSRRTEQIAADRRDAKLTAYTEFLAERAYRGSHGVDRKCQLERDLVGGDAVGKPAKNHSFPRRESGELRARTVPVNPLLPDRLEDVEAVLGRKDQAPDGSVQDCPTESVGRAAALNGAGCAKFDQASYASNVGCRYDAEDGRALAAVRQSFEQVRRVLVGEIEDHSDIRSLAHC